MSMNETQRVIEHLRRNGGRGKGWYWEHQDPRPLDEKTLASLPLPDGRPLPPSLEEWLRFDTSWFKLTTGEPPRLNTRLLRDMFREWAEPMANSGAPEESGTVEQWVQGWTGNLPNPAMADAHALKLPPSGSQEHFLVFHRTGRSLECPVLGFASQFEFWVKYKDFGEYLSHYFGLSKKD
ncbi:hypothetical protein [Vitiosangium sp. GDMCC 1.1324]|uniref:hypothetical protein n=1 Tax=Vitiosangium sp. (strain GDMCC 1.1324) TaxID=2138576 RepID=UPI000D3AF8E5|nr:hypothetical protein [Vitiosangium sp. GDMCC 1.1324]PTL78813.1 hypothetical protein DAT35_37785 [Vitiosangium sp. GDMCC 1.1324]